MLWQRMLCLVMALGLLITQNSYSLAPRSDTTQVEQALKEKQAKSFIAATPLLTAWAKDNPSLIRRCKYTVWQELYATTPPEKVDLVFKQLSALGYGPFAVIKTPADARHMALALLRLEPIFKDSVIGFLELSYPLYKKAFRRELPFYWPAILDVLVASVRKFPEARGNLEIVSGIIIRLKIASGKQFKVFWPIVQRLVEALGINSAASLPALYEFKLKAPELSDRQIQDIGELLMNSIMQKENWPHEYLANVLPAIKRAAGRSWTNDWPRVLEFIRGLGPEGLQLLHTPMTQLRWPFNNLDEIRQAVQELKKIAEHENQDNVPIVWYFQKRFGSFTKTSRDKKILMDILKEASSQFAREELGLSPSGVYTIEFKIDPKSKKHLREGMKVNNQILSLLGRINIASLADFTLAVEACSNLLEKHPLEKILSVQDALLFQDMLDPIDFAMLYPAMLDNYLPLTPEVIRQWHALRDSAGGDDKAALAQLGKCYPEEMRGIIYIPARAYFESTEQALRLLDYIRTDPNNNFIVLGPLVDADGHVLEPAPKAYDEHQKKYKRLFGTADNLLLVPVRNPLAYSYETFHNRSFEPDEDKNSAKEKKTIGKGVGVPEGIRKNGVLASYNRGAGVHRFYGGFDSDEKAAVEEAEFKMKEAFARAMQNPKWQAIAEFFHIGEDNLFLGGLMEVKPLALPAYLISKRAKAKFKGKIFRIPACDMPFGIRLVKTQPLLKHMGIGTIAADGKSSKTAQVSRIYYYQTPEKMRLYQIPRLDTSDHSLAIYSSLLRRWGIKAIGQEQDKETTVAFQALNGQQFPDRVIRSYLFLGFLARTALLTHILHHDMRASGSNKWGSIFSSININPFTVFDYDTIVLPDDPRFSAKRRQQFQKDDIRNLLNEAIGSIPFFYHLLGEYDGPRDWTELWTALYKENFDAFFKATDLLFTGPAQVPAPMRPDGPEAFDHAL